MSSTDPSTITVTNELTSSDAAANPSPGPAPWDGSIIVINGFDTSTTQTELGYEQTLELLPLASGNASLAPGATDSVAVPQEPGTSGSQSSSGPQPNPVLYLIAAQPGNLFPVSTGAIMPGFTPPFAYAPQTVTASELASCMQALAFLQTFQAYPTSSLAQQFVQAGGGGSLQNAQNSINAISQFFQGTKQFQSVTFDSYVAVSTYVSVLPFACANFQSSYTYYVYSSSSSGGTSAIPLGTVVLTLEGSVTVSNAATCYTITWLPSSGPAVPLTYSNGQLVSSVTEDIPSIALQFLYTPLSTYTGKSSDYQTIVPTLGGNVQNTQVIGINQSPDLGDELLEGIQDLFNIQIVKIFMQIAGFCMCVGITIKALGWVQKKIAALMTQNDGAPPTNQQIEEAEQAANTELTNVREVELPRISSQIRSDSDAPQGDSDSANVNVGSNPERSVGSGTGPASGDSSSDAPPGTPSGPNLAQMQEDLQVNLSNFSQAGEAIESISLDYGVVQFESSAGVNPTLEQTAQNLEQDEQQITNLDLSNPQASANLQTIETNINQQTQSINQLAGQEDKSFTASQESQIKASQTEETDLENAENKAKSDSSDDDDDDEDLLGE